VQSQKARPSVPNGAGHAVEPNTGSVMQRLLILLVCFPFLPLPAAENPILDKTSAKIPMRDGVLLAADIYRPADDLPRPVVLYRTPYNKETDHLDNATIQLVNQLGYVYVVQDTRGRFASEGIDSLFVTDGWGALQDGTDTINWLIRQSWCNGKVGQFGASASGVTTYRSVGAAHPNLVCAVAIVAAADMYPMIYPGGELQKHRVEEWIESQKSAYLLPFLFSMPYDNEFWRQMSLTARAGEVTAAVLHVGGWYDCFIDGTIQAYTALRNQDRAGLQRLIVGPWVHTDLGKSRAGELVYPGAEIDLTWPILQWFDLWLKQGGAGAENFSGVTYYLMGDPACPADGGCTWIAAETWPPATRLTSLFPHPDNSLAASAPAGMHVLSFDFDPAQPVPTVGGNNQAGAGISDGPRDQRILGWRSDVLEFATAPLTAPWRIEGTVKGRIVFLSDRPDIDLTLKLIDVYPDGREMIVTDGIRRARFRQGFAEQDAALLDPAAPDSLEIVLPPTAIVFSTGHRIKVAVSSSNYPRFEVNPNTGSHPNDRSNPVCAQNQIFLGAGMSRIELPVVTAETAVARTDIQPARAAAVLLPNYPNPFNPQTTIGYQLSEACRVRLSVFNLAGQEVARLQDGWQEAGIHSVQWHAMDQPSGVYLVRLNDGEGLSLQRIVLLK